MSSKYKSKQAKTQTRQGLWKAPTKKEHCSNCLRARPTNIFKFSKCLCGGVFQRYTGAEEK